MTGKEGAEGGIKEKFFVHGLKSRLSVVHYIKGRGNPERSGGRRRHWLAPSVTRFSGDWAG